MWVSERVRCLGCGRLTHAVEACEGCGEDLCGQCAERGKCGCVWTEEDRRREAHIRERVLRQLEDGGWHRERAVLDAVKSREVSRAEAKAVLTEMVWGDEVEGQGRTEGVREQRQMWVRQRRASNDQT